MNGQTDDARRRRFLLGTLCAWTPFLALVLPTLFGVAKVLGAKVTGLAAVAGGLSEAFVAFGIIAALGFEIAAVALLARTFSRERPGRALLALLSLGCSGLTITVVCLFLWLTFSSGLPR